MKSNLIEAKIKKYSIISTRKKNTNFVYKMSGFIGSLTFSNIDTKYIPILRLGEIVGIGNKISYSLGMYKIKYI